ncbi:DUF1353 domain-containing protein [Roseisolibacter agri]|uniref:DUF1353 domain-containing protein n=1 Tax=Roseisolibacter agri TaxID=2014610 RepID=A0AA37Q1V3_9BACT|nr:DUF1353 domain-containing protein [Roseisolibacter agri]GLC25055.1 hypothetical protein rosag_15680 [Roseisolibacter agri]
MIAQPELRRVAGEATLRELLADYDCYDRRRGVRIVVPAGFRLDGPSVPRLAAPLVTREDLKDAAPTVHDWFYARGGEIDEEIAGGHVLQHSYSRAEADLLFLVLLLLDDVVPWRAWISYVAVRLRGASHWRGDGVRVQRAMRRGWTPGLQRTALCATPLLEDACP